MVDKKFDEIKADFHDFIQNERTLAIIIFGSQANSSASPNSDVDVCIVAGNNDIDETLSKAWQEVGGKYDLWIFEELPVYMQAEIIENHKIVYCKSEPELYEYLYDYRKKVETYHYRLRVAYGDLEP